MYVNSDNEETALLDRPVARYPQDIPQEYALAYFGGRRMTGSPVPVVLPQNKLPPTLIPSNWIDDHQGSLISLASLSTVPYHGPALACRLSFWPAFNNSYFRC